MPRLLSIIAGLSALAGFVGFTTRLMPVWLAFPLLMAGMAFVLARRVAPEVLFGPADPALPPPAPALAEGTAQGAVGRQATSLTVRVHPDRIVVGQPVLGFRTIMADQLTGLGWEHDGALRIDHVAGTLRSAPVWLRTPPGGTLRQAIEAFAARRPVLPAPTPAPGWWTFTRVWALAVGLTGAGLVVFEIARDNATGTLLGGATVFAGVVVWFLASWRR